MQLNRGMATLGLFLIIGGALGLAVNLGYLQFTLEMIAGIPLLFGFLLLTTVLSGERDNLFPALLFVLISVPLYLTLLGYSGQRFWPLWMIAPGLAFLGASLQGGPWRPMAVPGVIVTGVGLFFLGQEWWNLDWQLLLSGGLVVVGVLLLCTGRRRNA